MRHVKRFFKRAIIFLFIFLLVGTGSLFCTNYGHELRTIVAESILTSQHPQLVKYTFLSQDELKQLTNKISNPAWKNVDNSLYGNWTKKQIEEKKKEPLKICVEKVSSDENSRFPFEGKLVTISNPFNVKLTSQHGSQGKGRGEKISVMAQRNHALVAVNASGFDDETGRGGGDLATGIVIENGKAILTNHESGGAAIVAGLTKYGQMITGKYSAQQLLNKQVVYAAGFMPQLIVNGKKMITEGDGGWGSAPRTIMAQKKDGAIMFLVIDGRQAHSIGATLKECQDILYEKGAINAMAMDGGASSTLYLWGKIRNSPSTLSHKDRFLPNAWIVAANQQQKVEVTMAGARITPNV
ncbi:branched-chain amino acid ABC transporter permease [Bacillus cereus]|uniref:Branched-chain amino acid ABC transporter permease n=1 Tax=Bacillus cereus TaxID=1396 RepID=A0A9X7GST4_BACCE|nr:phosphodiester glycosidase family protein [Bacillus cereus]PGS63647.1 branched-chain amino acid ABC transporter permease [Bacillus cereus]